MKYRIGEKQFDSIQKAGAAWNPGDRIVHADGTSLSAKEVDEAMKAWLRAKKRAA